VPSLIGYLLLGQVIATDGTTESKARVETAVHSPGEQPGVEWRWFRGHFLTEGWRHGRPVAAALDAEQLRGSSPRFITFDYIGIALYRFPSRGEPLKKAC
jgi:hypothetical protein